MRRKLVQRAAVKDDVFDCGICFARERKSSRTRISRRQVVERDNQSTLAKNCVHRWPRRRATGMGRWTPGAGLRDPKLLHPPRRLISAVGGALASAGGGGPCPSSSAVRYCPCNSSPAPLPPPCARTVDILAYILAYSRRSSTCARNRCSLSSIFVSKNVDRHPRADSGD